MRQYLILFALVWLTFASCKKNNSPDTLNGSWRMIFVKDKATNTTTTRPNSESGEVEITLTLSTSSNGSVSGHTSRNQIRSGQFSIGNQSAITFSELAVTKVMETPWGEMFLNNIGFSIDFYFTVDRNLAINTSTNKTLTFTRQ